MLREVFGTTATYGADVDGLATARSVDGSVDVRTRRAQRGRRLARAQSWDDATARHEQFYASVAPGSD